MPASKPQQASTKSSLQTVDRALAVLLSYSTDRTEWGVLELAREFDLDKSAAQRLLSSLAHRGFLYADPTTRRYRLGPATWRIASTWERRGGMALFVEPLLNELASITSRTASFNLADGSHVRCVAAVDGGDTPIRDHPLVGELYPAHAGATSRAYFAFLSPAQRQTLMYHRPLAKFSELTSQDAHTIEAEMLSVAEAGWAFSEGEYDDNTRAIAAPVFVLGRPVGSIGIGELKHNAQGDIRDHSPSVLRAAARLGEMLSAQTPVR